MNLALRPARRRPSENPSSTVGCSVDDLLGIMDA
jgi:hypothetical protein